MAYNMEMFYQSTSNPTIQIPVNELETTMEQNPTDPDYFEFIKILKKVEIPENE